MNLSPRLLLTIVVLLLALFLPPTVARGQGGEQPLTALTAPSTASTPSDDFVITVKTDNEGTSSNTQFTIPTTGGGYNYNVDCDDDGVNEATGLTGNYICNYATAGTYTVRIKDNS
ncbi:MAG: hypothetical protein GXP37_15705, partial [Chloroflexi bacterium]|nr:hypothetical protein [Chloroflexota bacterium]